MPAPTPTNVYRPITTPPVGVEVKKATLKLADGLEFEGYSFGADHSVAGETVFQTGMVGYNESLTDPSYRGQLLLLTYPMIGNYGSPSWEKDEHGLPLFYESDQVHAAGMIVATYCYTPNHWNSIQTLGDMLKAQGVPAICGVDTR
eukprot:GFYU01014979.1.p1 GENE.GFYU01014979.1~~GFYU01014979.1.p1  ORF type:complete len:146 (-),score=42.38 GFYU01014979.1:32-469(-)